MNLEAESHFKLANEYMNSIAEKEKEVMNMQEELDMAIINFDSAKASSTSFFKRNGEPISIIKELLNGESTVIEARVLVNDLTREVKGKHSAIKFLYSRVDMEKKALSQIQSETQRAFNN